MKNLITALFALCLCACSITPATASSPPQRLPDIVTAVNGGKMTPAVRTQAAGITSLSMADGTLTVAPAFRFDVSPQDPQPAPNPWSGAVFYDARSHETAVVIMHPLTTFHNVLGHRTWNLELEGFAGATTTTKAAVAGATVGKSFPLADKVSAFLGVGFTGQLGGSIGAGVVASAVVRF